MIEQEILNCVEIEPKNPAKYSIIWLHGLGADGHDFASIAPELNTSDSNVRFVFPHAPVMPITLNNGYEMRAWFDVSALSIDAKIDMNGINQSATHIGRLIEREVERGINTNHIFLAGFSQGAVMAMVTGLCYPKPLGGIIALSGFLTGSTDLADRISPANEDIPIFLAHGKQDPIVPYALGLHTKELLTKMGYLVDWHSYDMPHSVCAEEVDDLRKWLEKNKKS